MRLVWSSLAAGGAWAIGCTSLSDPPSSVLVDADAEVLAQTDDVQVVIETSAAGGGWDLALTRRFTPELASDWPLRLRVTSPNAGALVQVTATARDKRSAVVAQTRLIADPKQCSRRPLHLHFDRECLGRSDVCGAGLNCSRGACVDARLPPTSCAASDAGMPAPDAASDPPPPATVDAAGVCSVEGALSCADHASRSPLRCHDGSWDAQLECGDSERCDTTAGATHGQCLPISTECHDQQPGVPFCDDQGHIRVCADLVSSEIKPCADNERCLNGSGTARCACAPGFVDEGAGCREPTTCVNEGGCDPLTMCAVSNGKRVCGPCPDGYVGDGAAGCVPLLLNLTVDNASLEPAFLATTRQYQLSLAMLAQHVAITAKAPSNVQLTFNGTSVASGETWVPPPTAVGDTPITVTLTSRFGVTSTYTLVMHRTVEQIAYLKSSNGDSYDYFGVALAVSGDTLVVGAPGEDSCATGTNGPQANNACSNNGAVYLFGRQADGSWSQQTYLKAKESIDNQYFGFSVALAGNTLAVGAVGVDLLSQQSPQLPGAVYVFGRSGDTWEQQARLTAGGGLGGDAFGYRILLADDNTLVVGAPLDDTSASNAGAVYVFARNGSAWQSSRQLRAGASTAEGRFGAGLALDGDRLIVGAPLDDSSVTRSGAAYAFARTGSDWVQTQQLFAPTLRSQQSFGFAAAMLSDTLLVSALSNGLNTDTGQPTASTAAGAVYVFEPSGMPWTVAAMLQASEPRVGDYFGSSLALSTTTLVIGANGDASGSRAQPGDPHRSDANGSGASYVYAKDGGHWVPIAYLKAANADAGDGFGSVVLVTDELALIGAPFEDSASRSINANADDNSQTDVGAVYVFR
jgi:hypothetical protein